MLVDVYGKILRKKRGKEDGGRKVRGEHRTMRRVHVV